METWRFITFSDNDPYGNLSLEEAIARCVGAGLSPNTLCFYINDKCVVLGYFQSVETEANPDFCKKHNVLVLRRVTGGGSVYHDLGNLNFSVSIKKPHRLISKDLLVTLRTLVKPVINTLEELGLDAEFDERNSIFIQGRKVSGIASALKWGAFLLHGTLLVDSKLDVMNQVLKTKDSGRSSLKRKFTQSLRKPVTTLSDELQKRVAMSEIQDKLKIMFKGSYEISSVEIAPTEYELSLSRALLEEKYGRLEWNLKM